jgi:4-hydroxyacetophenone monooxygenase
MERAQSLSSSLGSRPPMEGQRLDAAEIRDAIAIANIPALLMVLFQTTGDERWLNNPYRPVRGKGLDDHDSGGLDESRQAEVRKAAVKAFLDLQSGKEPAVPDPSPELVVRMMSVCMGEEVSSEYGPMLSTELARRLGVETAATHQEPLAAPEGFRVLVVGTGVAGIAAAHQLEDMNIPYTILEKNPAPGGNWWQTTYPGAGVDTPSHLYSFSFAKNDWSKHFEMRDDLNAYFQRVLAETGGEKRVRYGTEVVSADFDEARHVWNVQVRTSQGTRETLTANVLISAVGVLNRPKRPSLPGMDAFQGIQFHTAEWPEGLDLEGKRVAIVGTGASAMQIVPAIVDKVAALTIFQRSPQWVAPFEKFQKPIPEALRDLLQSFPLYHSWYWLRLFWQFGDKVIEALRKDPDWAYPERSVNARNDGHREYFTRYIKDQLGDRHDLLEKVLPDYPPFGKRILLDNGWYAALRRDHVSLVNESVAEVLGHGIVSASGQTYDADVLIWSTGFDAARFVASMDVRGISGVSLREAWDDDDPRAYLGISVPGFPNFFMLGGPNSFPGSGSFMFFMEVQMRYIRGLLTEMFKRGVASLDAGEVANKEYNELVDRTHEETVWTHPGMQTYYRNSRGRVVFVMPFLNVDYWNMTREVKLEDYTLRT